MPEDKRHIFKTANIYLQEGRWDKAIVEFKRLVAIDPDDLSAHNILGDAYVKKGSLKEAFQQYLVAAEGYGRRGEGDKANPIYRKISKLDVKDLEPEDAQKLQVISLIVSGDAAYEEGNLEGAAKSYEEVVRLSPGNVEVTYKLGDISARLGKTKEAAANFQAVAKVYLEARLFKRALLCYQKVAELDPGNVDARLALADLLAREGQELEARKELQAITELFISQGQLDKAQSCAQRAIQLKSIDAHYLMGEIFIRREMYDEARASLESFLKIKANHIPGQFALGTALFKKGALDEALAAFGKILGKHPDHVEALERLAEIYDKKDAKLDAIVQHLNLAQVFVSQRIMDRAEKAIRKALALDPGHMDAHRRLGELFETRGLKREAAQEYLAALKTAKEQNLANDVAQCETKIRAIDAGLLGEQAPAASAPAPAPAAPEPASPAATSAAPEAAPPVAAPAEPAAEPAAAPSAQPEEAPPAEPELATELAMPPEMPAPIEEPASQPKIEAPPPEKKTPVPPPAEKAVSAPKPKPAPPKVQAPPVAPASLASMEIPAAAAPPKPKAALTPEQRAQRMISMAQSALKQGLFDEALDMLQQAQQQMPNDQGLKDTVQNVIKKYASTTKGGKKLPAAFMMAASAAKSAAPEPVPEKAAAPEVPAEPAAPAAQEAPPVKEETLPRAPVEIPAEPEKISAAPEAAEKTPEPVSAVAADEVEAQIVASAEKEYQERQERERDAARKRAAEQAAKPAEKAKPEEEAEPSTETMADIYLQQGHIDEAIRIYEKIWKDAPHRTDLAAKIEDLRRAKAPAPPPPPPPAAAPRAKPRISYV